MNIKLLLPILLAVYTVFITYNLLGLPLYLDEGLYIFWAYLFRDSPGLAYVSMQDGKTPLFIWLTYYFNPLLNNYLLTGRLISAAASVVTLICSSIIAWRIFGKKTALFVYILFLITPFNILISRMAFVDSLLIAFGTLSILSLILLREFSEKKKIALSALFASFTGVFLGLAFMTKTTARLFLVGEILVIILWGILFIKDRKFKTAGILAISLGLIIGLYYEILGYIRIGALRYWDMIAVKESDLVFNLPEILNNITGRGAAHIYFESIPLYVEYLAIYFGVVLVFGIIGLYKIIKDRKQFWLVVLLLIFSTAVLLSAKITASRYFSIIIPIFIIISATGLNLIWDGKSRALKGLSVALIIISFGFSLRMVADPINAIYARDDRSYFVESEINALGLIESIELLKPQSDDSIVGIEASWGVQEGMATSFGEAGIETQLINNVVPTSPSTDTICADGYKEGLDECWRANFRDIPKSLKNHKYIYLTATQKQMELLDKISDFKIEREFRRPTGITSYLIKLN